MEEQASIFSDIKSNFGSAHIYSLSRWSAFLGVVSILIALTILLLGISFPSIMEGAFSLSDNTIFNPLLSLLQDLPFTVWVISISAISIFLAAVGYLFLRIAKFGKEYYHTQSSGSFIRFMAHVRYLFIVGIVISSLTLITTLLEAIRFF